VSVSVGQLQLDALRQMVIGRVNPHQAITDGSTDCELVADCELVKE